MRRWWLRTGLGLLVGAVLHGSAGAQVRDTVRTRADSLKADSLRADSTTRARADSVRKARIDSLRADSLMQQDLAIIREQQRRGDSIKVATPAAEMPRLAEHPGVFRWDRAAIGKSGALSLGDLLETVPGVTVFRTGWLASPEHAAYLGDFRAMRVFQDGIELDNMDPRNGEILEISMIPLWPLEEVRVERGAFETRVYLQTWRVRSTTPSTRVDIGNGDLQTNAYRGYYGRRFGGGQVLQLGGQQFSTRDPRDVGDGDQLSLFGRTGWARGRWGADVTFMRTRRERTQQERIGGTGVPLAPIDLTNADVMARASYVDTTTGLWAQVVGARLSHKQTARLTSNNTTGSPAVSDTIPDSTAFSTSTRQYVGAVGWSRGRAALSATVRVRDQEGTRSVSPMLRGSMEWWRLVASGSAERRDDLGFLRAEGSVRVQPWSRLALIGAASRTTFDDSTITGSPLAFRGEAAWRVKEMWVGGGLMQRDPVRLPPPVLFDSGYRMVPDAAATGMFVTARGRFWKDVGFDATGVRWTESRGFRPEFQAHTQLFIDTDWLSRFPSGNLNIRFALTHDYRTQAPFVLDKGVVVQSSQYRLVGFQLEIRLMQATLSYQFRNFLNETYSQVPGFRNSRPAQFYGVRWNFFN